MLDSFIAHSSLPVQKIIWAYEGTYNSSNPYWTVDDDMGMTWTHVKVPVDGDIDMNSFLIDGIWTSDDWRTSYQAGFLGKVGGWKDSGGSWSQASERLDVSVGYNYVSLRGVSSWGNEIKFRMWAYMKESDFNSHAPQSDTAQILASNFQKTTGMAQLNLVAEVERKMVDGEVWTYNHNLGFRPLVRVWNRYHAGEDSTAYQIATDFYVGDEPEGYRYLEPTFTVDDKRLSIHCDLPSDYGDSITYLVRLYNYDTTI